MENEIERLEADKAQAHEEYQRAAEAASAARDRLDAAVNALGAAWAALLGCPIGSVWREPGKPRAYRIVSAKKTGRYDPCDLAVRGILVRKDGLNAAVPAAQIWNFDPTKWERVDGQG